MIKVVLKNNASENEIIVDENVSVKQILDENGMDYTTRMIAVNGETIPTENLTKTFKDLNVGDFAYVMAMKKLDNAA